MYGSRLNIIIVCAILYTPFVMWPSSATAKSQNWQDCESGDYKRVVRGCKRIIKSKKWGKKNRAVAYNNLGVLHSRKGLYDEAIRALTIALKLNPKYANAYNNRGLVYYDIHKFNKAIADYSEALLINPEYVKAYVNRGNAYSRIGIYEKAIVDYSQALRINPEDVKAYVNRGNVYNRRGIYEKAISDYSKALRFDPKFMLAYFNRGIAYNFKGEFDKAIADYTNAILLRPKYQPAYNGRGYSYLKKKAYDKAIVDFSKALRLRPQDIYSYMKRGNAYEKLGNSDKAINDFQRAAELREEALKKQKRPNANSLNSLAWALYKAKKLTEGLRYVKEALERDSKNLAAWDTLGVIQEALGNRGEAIRAYKNAYDLDPEHKASRGHLIRLGVFKTDNKTIKTIETSKVAKCDKQTDLTYWQSVKDSVDQDELKVYLDFCPKGTFAELVKIRLKKIMKK